MPTGRVCGGCLYFVRIRSFGRGRNGICDKYDYNCSTDSSYAKKCESYRPLKYKRDSQSWKAT